MTTSEYSNKTTVSYAANTNWWIQAGITSTSCVAAYQPKGAANLGASYSNLANPGTYDAGLGVAPTWDVTSGWIFNGSSQYLTTGITPARTWSVLARYDGVVSGGYINPLGSSNPASTGPYFTLGARYTTNLVLYGNGSNVKTVSPNLDAGVLAISGYTGYRNGVPEATITASSGGSFYSPYMGGTNNGGTPTYSLCNIQAVSFYNVVLTDAQILALATAIAAL